jgi:cytochrome c oxidase cbb3-type subunit III
MSELEDKNVEHEYDGIKEQNNKMPRWWVWLFILSIIWAVGYLMYFHVLKIGNLQADEYRKEMNPNYTRAARDNKYIARILEPYHSPYYAPERDRQDKMTDKAKTKAVFIEEKRESDTSTYIALTDQVSIAGGKDTYDSKCVSCHGKLGEGNIGPNLTDDYWIHGAGISNIVKTIKYGVPAKGMLAWQGELKKEQIIQVASYIMTLHGTHPPNGKAPQGDLATGK